MNHQKLVHHLLAWFARDARDLPWRRTRDPYAIWVSEIMLQQTQVKSVLPYWKRWMRALPDIQTLARVKPEKLHKLWEGLGYYTRVRNLQKAAQAVVAEHGGKFPSEFEAILALPGIGRYTAGAICSIAFNQPKPILDGNVMRVLTRVFGIAGNPRAKPANARLWHIAEQLVQQAAEMEPQTVAPSHASRMTHYTPRTWSPLGDSCSRLNQSLMELGALMCTARNPRCDLCPLAQHCTARREDRVGDFPHPTRRAKATPRRFVAFVVARDGRFLARQRPAGVVNAQLWEFPNVELPQEDSDLEKAGCKALGTASVNLTPFCTFKHSITRYRITLEVFQAVVNGDFHRQLGDDRWLARAQLRRLPFTSAHKKILLRLGKQSSESRL